MRAAIVASYSASTETDWEHTGCEEGKMEIPVYIYGYFVASYLP